MINMAKKKDIKEKEEPEKVEEVKIEKKVVNKQPDKLYSLEELAEIFGYSRFQLSSLFSVRGIDKNEKLSIEDAKKKFKNVMI